MQPLIGEDISTCLDIQNGIDNLQTLKKGDQELENWLRSLLSRNADFEFHTVRMNDLNVGVLIIYRAANQTVMFEKVDYIRVLLGHPIGAQSIPVGTRLCMRSGLPD